jgi:hypothetical protein
MAAEPSRHALKADRNTRQFATLDWNQTRNQPAGFQTKAVHAIVVGLIDFHKLHSQGT